MNLVQIEQTYQEILSSQSLYSDNLISGVVSHRVNGHFGIIPAHEHKDTGELEIICLQQNSSFPGLDNSRVRIHGPTNVVHSNIRHGCENEYAYGQWTSVKMPDAKYVAATGNSAGIVHIFHSNDKFIQIGFSYRSGFVEEMMPGFTAIVPIPDVLALSQDRAQGIPENEIAKRIVGYIGIKH